MQESVSMKHSNLFRVVVVTSFLLLPCLLGMATTAKAGWIFEDWATFSSSSVQEAKMINGVYYKTDPDVPRTITVEAYHGAYGTMTVRLYNPGGSLVTTWTPSRNTNYPSTYSIDLWNYLNTTWHWNGNTVYPIETGKWTVSWTGHDDGGGVQSGNDYLYVGVKFINTSPADSITSLTPLAFPESIKAVTNSIPLTYNWGSLQGTMKYGMSFNTFEWWSSVARDLKATTSFMYQRNGGGYPIYDIVTRADKTPWDNFGTPTESVYHSGFTMDYTASKNTTAVGSSLTQNAAVATGLFLANKLVALYLPWYAGFLLGGSQLIYSTFYDTSVAPTPGAELYTGETTASVHLHHSNPTANNNEYIQQDSTIYWDYAQPYWYVVKLDCTIMINHSGYQHFATLPTLFVILY